jgi:hypothetical protein
VYFVTHKRIVAQLNSSICRAFVFLCLKADGVMDAVVQFLDSEYFGIVYGAKNPLLIRKK